MIFDDFEEFDKFKEQREKFQNKSNFIFQELVYWNNSLPPEKKIKASLYNSYIFKFGDSRDVDSKKYYPSTPSLDSLANFLVDHKEAYYDFSTRKMFQSAVQTTRYFLFHKKEEPYKLADDLLKRSPSGLKSELWRLTEKERREWINKIGKNDCSFDGSCQGVFVPLIENEKPEELKKEEERWKLELQTARPENHEQLFNYHEWQKEKISEAQFKYVEFKNERKTPSYTRYFKNSVEVLEHLFIHDKKVYRTMPQSAYEIFSANEPKSNFNLIDNLIEKHWKNYPNIHSLDKKERYSAIGKFASDIKYGKIQEPEVEMLGFGEAYKEKFKKYQSQKQEIKQVEQVQTQTLEEEIKTFDEQFDELKMKM